MPNLGGWEFVILIGVLVLLFGAKRLPDMARSIGQSARVFKGEMKGMRGDDDPAGKRAEPTAAPAEPAALPPTAPSSTASTAPSSTTPPPAPPATSAETPQVSRPGQSQPGQ
jgi:sec-independent protein translocase protein TatA